MCNGINSYDGAEIDVLKDEIDRLIEEIQCLQQQMLEVESKLEFVVTQAGVNIL